MENLNRFVTENTVIMEADWADEQVCENVKELIWDKINEAIAEVQCEGNEPEFILQSELPLLELYFKALHELAHMGDVTVADPSEMWFMDDVLMPEVTAGYVRFTRDGYTVKVTMQDATEAIQAGMGMAYWMGDKQFWLDVYNMDTLVQKMCQASDDEFDAARECLEKAEEPEPEKEIDLMRDYGLWVGQCLIAPSPVLDNLTPYVYIQEFVSMAWLPPRKIMKVFLRNFYSKESVESFIDETFVWE